MKPAFVFFFLSLFTIGNVVHSQEKYTVSGYVKENLTGEYLIGANVYLKELMKGTTTNQYGFYSITIDQGDYTLVVSYLGFDEFSKEISLTTDLRENVALGEKAITTKEVVITGERDDKNTEDAQMGQIEMDIEQIKSLPAFMGEVDVLKTLQLLPGVQSAGDGNSGFYIRGGGPDQNLILLDEAVVYNASHLFGFFSIFNADAIKDVNLIKGGMPAQYGGRLASVLDISMKEGNSREYKMDGGIGVISSRLTVQGPIKKDTSSFIASARRTYAGDIIAPLFIPDSSNFAGSSYYFYDMNAKLNYRISDKDRIFLSGYFGRDVFNFNQKESGFNVAIPWGNTTVSSRWNHLFSDKLFLNTTLIYSDFNFSFSAGQDDFEFKLFSGITDVNAKFDFNYFPDIRNNIKFGGIYIWHTFVPSNVTAKQGETKFNTGDIIKQYAHESAIYINDEFDWTDRLKISAGMRVSNFIQVGPFTRYLKDDVGSGTDSIVYAPGEKVADYYGFEPRLTGRFKIDSKSSLKAGITHNYQYIHLASISSVSLPTDLWVPSSDIVKPQIGTQYALGYFRNFLENKWESSVEVYYKTMDNLVEYKEGAMPEDNVIDNPDNQFTFGEGWSYGAEFFLKRRIGQTTGWVGYTWSKTERKFEDLNQGEVFPAKYDRRHDLSIALTHDYSDRLTFAATFVYATGNAMTLPVERYLIEGNIVNEYGLRNSYRMPAYHRMDISATWKNKPTKRFRSSWNFAIYNVYNRANPFFIYFENQGSVLEGTVSIQAKQVSLFPILPSVTWNFNF